LPLQRPGVMECRAPLGWTAVEKPYRAVRRARRHAEFGMEPVGVVALGVGGVLVEASGLSDAFG
jgi:hypothetical protein